MLVDKQTYFKNHNNQNNFLLRKLLKADVFSLIILSCSIFNSDFVAKVCIFSFKSVLLINPETSDLLINYLFFIFASSISFINLL